VGRVVLIGRGSEGSGDFPEGPGQGRFPGEDANQTLKVDFNRLQDDHSIKDTMSQYGESLDGVLAMDDRRNLPLISSAGDVWLFRFFAYKGKRFVKKGFYNCVSPILQTNDPKNITTATLVSLLQNSAAIGSMRKCYEQHSNNVNNTSLVTFHDC
jgi:hypothetical protein